jgi:hypothetical protein
MAEETVAPVDDVPATDAQDVAATPAPVDVAVAADGEAASVAVAVADAPAVTDEQAPEAAPVEASAPPAAEAETETTTTTPEPTSATIADEDVPDEDVGVVAVGHLVHVTLDRGANTGECRPAIVVRVWNPEIINVQVFTDGLNDHQDYASGMVWMTSLHYARPVAGQPTPQTWHWSWED